MKNLRPVPATLTCTNIRYFQSFCDKLYHVAIQPADTLLSSQYRHHFIILIISLHDLLRLFPIEWVSTLGSLFYRDLIILQTASLKMSLIMF